MAVLEAMFENYKANPYLIIINIFKYLFLTKV